MNAAALLLWLFATGTAVAQVTPECTYTLWHSRPGSLAVFRNEKLLQPADYTRSNTLGRTVTLNSWSDQDQITYAYPYAATTSLPGTSPPSTILIWISTLEYHTCTGNLNAPPAPPRIVRHVDVKLAYDATAGGWAIPPATPWLSIGNLVVYVNGLRYHEGLDYSTSGGFVKALADNMDPSSLVTCDYDEQ